MASKSAKVFAVALVCISDFERLFTVDALHAGATIRRRLTSAVSATAPMLSSTAPYGQVCVHNVASGASSRARSSAVGREAVSPFVFEASVGARENDAAAASEMNPLLG